MIHHSFLWVKFFFRVLFGWLLLEAFYVSRCTSNDEKLILFSVDLTIALVLFFSLCVRVFSSFLCCCSSSRRCLRDVVRMFCRFRSSCHVLEGTISVYKHKRVNMIKKKRHVQHSVGHVPLVSAKSQTNFTKSERTSREKNRLVSSYRECIATRFSVIRTPTWCCLVSLFFCLNVYQLCVLSAKVLL